jgi:hypothetical protein
VLRPHRCPLGRVALQNSRPSSFFSNASSGMVLSSNGAMGASTATARRRIAYLLIGVTRIDRTTLKLLARSASDRMSALPSSGSLAGSAVRSHFASNART